MTETETAARSSEKELKISKKENVKGNDFISFFTSIVCVIIIVIIIWNLIMHFTTIANQDRTFTIDYKTNTFLMDGKPFRYVSGYIQYFRALPEAWHKRLRAMKVAGLNAIDIDVAWSLHNPNDGVYDWSGIADIEKLIKLAQREGFYIILRPGPCIGAEIDNGGLPYWLFEKYPGIQVRTSDVNYIYEVSLWFKQLMSRLQRFLYGNGGPIILVQIENEYGGFGACDHQYMKWLRDETLKYVSNKAVLFTSDYTIESLECGRVDGVFVTLNFGVNETYDLENIWNKLRTVQAAGPLVNSKLNAGCSINWHDQSQSLDPRVLADALNMILISNASVSLYMFSGGSNFGFIAGATMRSANNYTSVITSYGYDAILNEWGDKTEKFDLVRDVIGRYFRLPAIKPIREQTHTFGKVDLNAALNLFSKDGRAILGVHKFQKSPEPISFAELHQDFGLILYETSLAAYDVEYSLLTLKNLRDRAVVYMDEEFVGILSRQNGNFSLILNKVSGTILQILVENQGRNINNITNDIKGILGLVTLQNSNGIITTLGNWSHTGYHLNEIYIKKLLLSSREILTETSNYLMHGPTVYYGQFFVKKRYHTFLNTSSWGKGVAYVNGFNLGRYWPQAGPKLSLYVPLEILVRGRNTIILIELEKSNRASRDIGPYITLDNKPSFEK